MAATSNKVEWFVGGDQFFPALLSSIAEARTSIALEMYIFAADKTGHQFLTALTAAACRGVRVRVLVDSFGSLELAEDFFQPLKDAGGEMHFFNPLRFHRFGVRDHRKLLVCDNEILFIGGANIADEYSGNGVTQGWFDTVTRLQDQALATALLKEFDRLFTNAEFATAKRRRLRALRPLHHELDERKLFGVKPGRGAGVFQRALQNDLATASTADFITPYFLPRRKLRKLLRDVVRRGGRVRLLLPAISDVPLARLASQVYYARLLRAGIEIYGYQPQILHAKLYRVDGKIYCGSSNLDVRSLKLNYELMVCLTDNASVDAAKYIFESALKNSKRLELKEYLHDQTFWQRWKNYWAHFLLARIDPLIALRQMR